MADQLWDQIYNNMNLKETEELLEIWQSNDRAAWTETAFAVVGEILKKRLGEVPPQSDPTVNVFEEKEEDQYLDDDNQPVFYDPVNVLLLIDYLNWAARIALGLSVIYGFFNLPDWSVILNIGRPGFNATSILISILLTIAGTALQAIIFYFPLKALAYILKILMEFEFNSRGGEKH